MLKIQQELLFKEWSVVEHLPVNKGYELLVKKITDALDRHAPKKLVKIRYDKKFNEPWLSVKLLKYNQKCRKLCNKACLTGND